MERVTQTASRSRARRIAAWLREVWDEVDYAQRRMLELQMGIAPRRIPSQCSELDHLEAVFRLPAREPEHGLD
jgi:hypothetical protein